MVGVKPPWLKVDSSKKPCRRTIVKLGKAQSRCTGIEDRQSQNEKPTVYQNKQVDKTIRNGGIMAAFVIPDHNNTRFFNGPTGNSGVEEIAIQQGTTVLLEQSGDAGSPGSLPSLYSSDDNVASISKIISSGRSSQRFTLFAKNSGTAVLNGKEPKSGNDCVFPLRVIVGDYEHHTDMTIDLFADKLGKSDDAFKIYTAQRILNGGNDSVGDALIDNTNIFDQQSKYNTDAYGKLGCGELVVDRGQTLFGKDNVNWQPRIYYNAMPQTARRPLRRADLKYDPAKMLRARAAIGNLLKQGKAVKVGCLHHPERQSGPIPQPTLGGGHSVLIVGCNDQFTSFLYLDPWVGGSRLVYKGGIGRSGQTDECFYMGLFKSDGANPRGPVLRQDASAFGSFDESGFLEVINGPL